MALPLYDNQPTRRAPLVTYLLIAVNVVVFLLSPVASVGHSGETRLQRNCEQTTFLLKYGAIPKEMIDNRQSPMPEEVASACHPAPFRKRPWLSALSSMFLHGGVAHILGNMVYLFIFGAATEDRLGRLRFLLFYLLVGYIAAYGFAVTYPGSMTPLVGASGAIAGVLGSHLVLYPRSRTIALVLSFLPFRLPSWTLLVQFFVFQWFSLGDQSQTAYVAHIYGFVAGMICGLLVRRGGFARKSAALNWH
ncbi:rhomboid family intramembrane serine protease [Actinoallomurus oryzae]|uniref:Rhomboid family intramembrane serine protease n=1 Tax=Actinoallomurus oryzae TaxID=502180 RepID=A0ABP8QAG3_9ACTN